MEKKTVILFLLESFIILLWLFLVGQSTGQSGIAGDFNLIDEGQYAAWIGHMLHGKVIYKDMYVQYGPLLIYPIYFFIKMFGASVFFIRVITGAVEAFLGIVVAQLFLRRIKINVYIRNIILVFLVILPGIGIRYWLGILLIILVERMYQRYSFKYAFISGIVLATTVIESIEVGLYSLIIILGYSAILWIQSRKASKVIKILFVFLLVFIFALSTFAYFAWVSGWLGSYLQTTFDFVLSLSGINLPNGQGLPNPLSGVTFSYSPLHFLQILFSKAMLFYWSLFLLLLFASIGIIRRLLFYSEDEEGTIFLFICYSIFLYASIIGRSGHYFLIVPFVIITCGYYLSLLISTKKLKDKAVRKIWIIFFFLFMLYNIRHLIIFRYSIFTNLQTKIYNNSSTLRVAPLAISSSQARDIQLLQEFFHKETSVHDTIFIPDNAPGLYFLLDRENATRYDLPLLAVSKENRLEIISELETNQPLYIIEDQKAWAVDEVSDRLRLPEVFTYIQKHYKKYKIITHFAIYKKI